MNIGNLTPEEIKSLTEIQELMAYTPDYHCERCGAILEKPILKPFKRHIYGGTPMLCGQFRCPQKRWWQFGHTLLDIQYVHGHLHVYKGWEYFEQLWVHKLAQLKQEMK